MNRRIIGVCLLIMIFLTGCKNKTTADKYAKVLTYSPSATVYTDAKISADDVSGIANFSVAPAYSAEWTGKLGVGTYRVRTQVRKNLEQLAKQLIKAGFKYEYLSERQHWAYINDYYTITYLYDESLTGYIKVEQV